MSRALGIVSAVSMTVVVVLVPRVLALLACVVVVVVDDVSVDASSCRGGCRWTGKTNA